MFQMFRALAPKNKSRSDERLTETLETRNTAASRMPRFSAGHARA
jgi:hypothetical protein